MRKGATRPPPADMSQTPAPIPNTGGPGRASLPPAIMINPWTTCPVTLRALAMLDDATLDAIVATIDETRAADTRFGPYGRPTAHPPLATMWEGVDTVTLRALAHGRLVVDISFATATGGLARYADGRFEGTIDLPDTLLTALAGGPITRLLDHPLFEGLRFMDELQAGDVAGPPSDVRLDEHMHETVVDIRGRLASNPVTTTPGSPARTNPGSTARTNLGSTARTTARTTVGTIEHTA